MINLQIEECLQIYQENCFKINSFIIQKLFFNYNSQEKKHRQRYDSIKGYKTVNENDIDFQENILDQSIEEDMEMQKKINQLTKMIIQSLNQENSSEIPNPKIYEKINYLKSILQKIIFLVHSEIMPEYYPSKLEYQKFIDYIIESINAVEQKLVFKKNDQNHEIDYEDESFKQQNFVLQSAIRDQIFDRFNLADIPQFNNDLLKTEVEFLQDFKDCLEIIGQERNIMQQRKKQETLYLQYFFSAMNKETKTDLISKYSIYQLKFFDKFKLIEIVCDSKKIEDLEEDEAMLYFYFYSILNLIKSGYIFLNKEQKLFQLIRKLSTFSDLRNKEGFIFLMQLFKNINDQKVYSKIERKDKVIFSKTFILFRKWVETDYKVSEQYINKEQLKLFIDAHSSAIKLILLPEFASCYSIEENIPYQPTNLFIGYIQQCVRGKRLYLKYPDLLQQHTEYWLKLNQNLYQSINEERGIKYAKSDPEDQQKQQFMKEDQFLCLKISQINYQMCLLKTQSQRSDSILLIEAINSLILLFDCSQYKDICQQKQLYQTLKSLFIEEEYILMIIIMKIKRSFTFKENQFETQQYKNLILSIKQEFEINRYITRSGERIFTLQQVEVCFEQIREKFDIARKEYLQNKIYYYNEAQLQRYLINFQSILGNYRFLEKPKYQVFRTNIKFYIQQIKLQIELIKRNKQVSYEEVKEDGEETKDQKNQQKTQFEIKKVRIQNREGIFIVKRSYQNEIDLNKMNEDVTSTKIRNYQTIREKIPYYEQILREVGILLTLPEHKNIVELIDYQVSEKGELELFLEFCEQQSLQEYLQKYNKILTIQQRLKICKDIVEGVLHLQTYKIIHSDLKLSNLVVSKDGTVKLIDLGASAYMVEETLGFTQSYKNQDIEESQYSDYYSLGMILIKILHIFHFNEEYYKMKCKCFERKIMNCSCLKKHCKKFIKLQYNEFRQKEFENLYSSQLFKQIMNLFNDQPFLRPKFQELIELFDIHLNQTNFDDSIKEYSLKYLENSSSKISRFNIFNKNYYSILTKILQDFISIEKVKLIKQLKGTNLTYNEQGELVEEIDCENSMCQQPLESINILEVYKIFKISQEELKQKLQAYFVNQINAEEEYELRILKFLKELNLNIRYYVEDLRDVFNLELEQNKRDNYLIQLFIKICSEKLCDIENSLKKTINSDISLSILIVQFALFGLKTFSMIIQQLLQYDK